MQGPTDGRHAHRFVHDNLKGWMVLTDIYFAVLLTGVGPGDHGNRLTGAEGISEKMPQNIMEIRFYKETNHDPYPDKLDAFTSFIRMLADIPSSEGTMYFDFVIRYWGTRPVEVHNPLYYLQFTAMRGNEMLNTGYKPPIPLINTKSEIMPEDFNFGIMEFEENGKALNIPEEINRPTLLFERGDERMYRLSVPGFRDSGEIQPFSSGIYTVSFLFSIIVVKHGDEPAQHLTFKTSPVTVRIK